MFNHRKFQTYAEGCKMNPQVPISSLSSCCGPSCLSIPPPFPLSSSPYSFLKHMSGITSFIDIQNSSLKDEDSLKNRNW